MYHTTTSFNSTDSVAVSAPVLNKQRSQLDLHYDDLDGAGFALPPTPTVQPVDPVQVNKIVMEYSNDLRIPNIASTMYYNRDGSQQQQQQQQQQPQQPLEDPLSDSLQGSNDPLAAFLGGYTTQPPASSSSSSFGMSYGQYMTSYDDPLMLMPDGSNSMASLDSLLFQQGQQEQQQRQQQLQQQQLQFRQSMPQHPLRAHASMSALQSRHSHSMSAGMATNNMNIYNPQALGQTHTPPSSTTPVLTEAKMRPNYGLGINQQPHLPPQLAPPANSNYQVQSQPHAARLQSPRRVQHNLSRVQSQPQLGHSPTRATFRSQPDYNPPAPVAPRTKVVQRPQAISFCNSGVEDIQNRTKRISKKKSANLKNKKKKQNDEAVTKSALKDAMNKSTSPPASKSMAPMASMPAMRANTAPQAATRSVSDSMPKLPPDAKQQVAAARTATEPAKKDDEPQYNGTLYQTPLKASANPRSSPTTIAMDPESTAKSGGGLSFFRRNNHGMMSPTPVSKTTSEIIVQPSSTSPAKGVFRSIPAKISSVLRRKKDHHPPPPPPPQHHQQQQHEQLRPSSPLKQAMSSPIKEEPPKPLVDLDARPDELLTSTDAFDPLAEFDLGMDDPSLIDEQFQQFGKDFHWDMNFEADKLNE